MFLSFHERLLRLRRLLGKVRREVMLRHQWEERYILERKLFPLARNKLVLLVGCQDYTRDYPKRLGNQGVWTIDTDEAVSIYGATNHIVGSVVDVGRFFRGDSLDFIFMGGVIGFGLNSAIEIDTALTGSHGVLRPGGLLMIWWHPRDGQVDPRQLPGFALFSPVVVGGYPSGYTTRQRIVLAFLEKSGGISHSCADRDEASSVC